MSTPNEIIRAARTRLSANPTHACLSSALWAVKIVEEPECQSNGLPTMGVSKDWVLYYHPKCADWPLNTIETVWIHEIWHLLRSHAARAEALGVGPTTHIVWNIAADCEINDGLIQANMPFPPKLVPMTPKAFGFPDGLLAEEYYNKLSKAGQGQGQGQGKGTSGKSGQSRQPEAGEGQHVGGSGSDAQSRPWEKASDGKKDANGQGQTQKRIIQGELIKRQVADAIQRQQGSMPGSWKRWAGVVLAPKRIPWETIIRATIGRIVTSGKREDYTYSRPSRRDFPGGFVMPGQFGTLPELAVGVDTSGSMADKELEKAVGIIESVLEYHGRMQPVTVISGDTCVNNVKKTLQARKVELIGGGGTDMKELIKYAETQLKPRPAAFVLVTDGFTDWPKHQPSGMQLVVLIVPGGTTNGIPKWATIVQLS